MAAILSWPQFVNKDKDQFYLLMSWRQKELGHQQQWYSSQNILVSATEGLALLSFMLADTLARNLYVGVLGFSNRKQNT